MLVLIKKDIFKFYFGDNTAELIRKVNTTKRRNSKINVIPKKYWEKVKMGWCQINQINI